MHRRTALVRTALLPMIALAAAVSSAAAAPGQAVVTDAEGGKVRVAGTAVLRPTGQVAVEAWVKLTWTGSAGADVISMGDSYRLRLLSTGNAQFTIYNTSGSWKSVTTSGVNVKNGQWHHVVGQKTASNLEVYVDGAFKVRTGNTNTIRYTLGPDLIMGDHGNGGSSSGFAGSLDEPRVYNRALTAAEISAHYNAGAGQYGAPETGLVGGWHLDEGTGTAAADYSGNNHAATLLATAAWVTGLVALPAQTSDTTPPAISSLTASPTKKPYPGGAITVTATASDNSGGALQYQFSLNGSVVRAWASGNTYAWTAPATASGLHVFNVDVRDPSLNVGTRSANTWVLTRPVEAPQP